MGSTIADAAHMETKELRAIQVGFDRLIAKILPAVEAGEFGMVIGDDTTGRIPARFIHSFINSWNDAHNLPRIPLVFIQGTSSGDQLPKLRHALDQRAHLLAKRLPDTRALVVTEGISTGGSIARLGGELTARGITFDVAVLDGEKFTRNPDVDTTPASRADIDAFAALLRSAQHPVSLRTEDLIGFWNSHVEADVRPADVDRFNEAFTTGTLTGTVLHSIPCHQVRSSKATSGTVLAQQVVLAANSQRFPSDAIESFIGVLATHDLPEQVFQSMKREWFTILTTDRILMERGIQKVTQQATPRDHTVTVSTIDAVGWPTETRLFRGKMNAGPIRNRPDLTGLALEKFSSRPLYESTKEDSERQRQVRADLRRYAKWSCERAGFTNDAVPSILPHLSSVLQQLEPALQKEEYAFILGQNTGGRLPAKLLGKAINAWRSSQGKAPLPIVFLDGNRIPHTPYQIAAAERLATHLPAPSGGKRALIVADPSDAGTSVPSIVERMNDIGFASDLVHLLGLSQDRIKEYLSQGLLRPETRAFSSAQGIDDWSFQSVFTRTAGVSSSAGGTARDLSVRSAQEASLLQKDLVKAAGLLARELG